MKPNSLKKNLLVIALAAVCIGAVTFVLLLFSARTFPVYMRDSEDGYRSATAEIADPAVVEMVSAEKQNDNWVVTFRALKPGGTEIAALFEHSSEVYGDLKDSYHTYLYVTRFGTILEPADLSFRRGTIQQADTPEGLANSTHVTIHTSGAVRGEISFWTPCWGLCLIPPRQTLSSGLASAGGCSHRWKPQLLQQEDKVAF